MYNGLSVVLITKNEEKNIIGALKSATFASEIIVLDSGSDDNTCKLAKKYGAKVFHQDWLGFSNQKNKAVSLSKNDWVFVLDADERFSEDLIEDIKRVLINPKYDGYFIPRRNHFFGKFIRYCGLYPDYSIRLFNKNKGEFSFATVHESVLINGKVGYLKNALIHKAYEDIDEFINKQRKYAELSNKKRSPLKAFFSPIWIFIKIYFIRLGILEGWRGFVIALTYARYTFWKYTK